MELSRKEMKNIIGGVSGLGKCTATCKDNASNTEFGTVEVTSCGGTELTACVAKYPSTTVAVCSCTGA